jgi:hypothetical protein
MLVSPQEHFLRNILGLSVISGEARRDGKHQILMGAKKRGELDRRASWLICCLHCCVVTYL